jgi:hypothetical protein
MISKNIKIKIYRTIILPVFCVKLGLSHCSRSIGLRVFENRLIGKIFRHEGDEVTGEWRRLHNE